MSKLSVDDAYVSPHEGPDDTDLSNIEFLDDGDDGSIGAPYKREAPPVRDFFVRIAIVGVLFALVALLSNAAANRPSELPLYTHRNALKLQRLCCAGLSQCAGTSHDAHNLNRSGACDGCRPLRVLASKTIRLC